MAAAKLLGLPAQTDREKEALETIETVLASVEAAHRMIAQLCQTVIALNERVLALEGAKAKPGPRLILPNSGAVGHG